MKNISKNFILSILCKIVYMITGFVIQRAILVQFGSDVNGLTSTVTQILSYVSLLEAGLGTASIQALYLPLSKNNWNDINGILSATNKQYVKTGGMFLGVLVSVSFIVPVIVNGDISQITMGVLTLLIGMSNVLSYTFMGKYTALLTADKRLYVINCADMIATITSCVFRLFAINIIGDIILVQAIHLCSIVLKIVIINLYVRKRYKSINFKATPDYKAVSKRWSVLIHHIASMVVNHTSVIILSVAENLKMVSLYSVYNYVFNNIYMLMTAGFSQAPLAMFGRWYNQDMKVFTRNFRLFEIFFSIVINTVLFTALIMIMPFVANYTDGVSDVEYVDWKLAVLFFITSYLNIIRMPSVMAINVSGMFKETQRGAVIEAIINLSVALILLKPLGIYGLLIASIVSYLYRTPDVIYFTYSKIINKSVVMPMLQALVNVFIGVILSVNLIPMVQNAHNSWLEWVMWAFLTAIFAGIIFIFANVIMNIKYIKCIYREWSEKHASNKRK